MTEDQGFLSSAWKDMADQALDESVQDFKQGARDPNAINDEVRVVFEDIIAEPDDYHSSNYVWHMSSYIFNWGKDAAYQFFSFVFGVPLSLFWGCFFALTACLHVWCYAPLKRSQSIKMGCWKQFLTVTLSVIFDPLFESAGKTFSQIDVQHTTEKITID